ncbi:MAG: cyclic-di-AMP receptor [Anaerolineales bacterium]|nr:cyclic-di-AMP receptor [Anaerolineales bacterium]
MKLMIAIVREPDDVDVIRALVEHGFRVTRVASTGGFLRRGNATLMIGLEAQKVDEVFELLHQTCHPAEGEEHRATVFVANLPSFEYI